jgi:DNA-directed RNA polymerase subunit E'/Rpb7
MKMNKITITRRICMHSKYLDQDISDHILRELTSLTLNECGKEHGHIISVNKINKIVNHKIGRANSDNVFTVEFEALSLNPKVGTAVVGRVCMVYKDGIFINIMNKQKMLIPATSLIKYEFDELTGSYKGSESSIRVDDELEAVITASQYRNGRFSCYGALKGVYSTLKNGSPTRV